MMIDFVPTEHLKHTLKLHETFHQVSYNYYTHYSDTVARPSATYMGYIGTHLYNRITFVYVLLYTSYILYLFHVP